MRKRALHVAQLKSGHVAFVCPTCSKNTMKATLTEIGRINLSETETEITYNTDCECEQPLQLSMVVQVDQDADVRIGSE